VTETGTVTLGGAYFAAGESSRFKDALMTHFRLYVGPLGRAIRVASRGKPLLLVASVRIHLRTSLS
jgi:hypothetical protein